MKTALIGLPQSGKSTLFSAVSGKKIQQAGAINIQEAIVPVPDERLDFLASLYKPEKTIYATIDCLDVPGFNFNDSHLKIAAAKLIHNIRTVELLVFVIRAFDDPAIPPYRNSVDTKRDLQELKTELLLADLELVTARIEKLEKQIHKPTKTQAQDKAELKIQQKLQQTIEAEKPISSAIESDAELAVIKSFGFLTLKPIVIAVNVAEDQLEKKFDFEDLIDSTVPVIEISAKLEHELSLLDTQSKNEFMADLGLTASVVCKFVNSCYSALGLVSFLTHGAGEVRAWPVKQGTNAHDAAGKVHSDIKRGFIRAETFTYDDLKQFGDEKAVKAAGKTRLEGKDYIVQDGDIINFRFNV